MASPITVKPISTPAPQGLNFDLGASLGSTVLVLVIVIGAIFGVIILLYVMKKLKRYDPFLEQFMIKKNQCKMFRDPLISRFYIENDKDGLVKMGTYEGDAIDKEGFHNILFSNVKLGAIGRWIKRLLFFASPLLDLIMKKYWIVRVNTNSEYKSRTVQVDPADPSKQNVVETTVRLPVAKVIKGNGSIIIHCWGLQMKKYFTYPIMQSKSGFVIQDEAINFERERDSILTDTLYEQTIDFANVLREAINMNPNARFINKTDGKTLPSDGGQS